MDEQGLPAAWQGEQVLLVDQDAARLRSPALLLYPEHVRHNLKELRTLLGGSFERLRPHIKTCKTPRILQILLEAGLRRFKCATVREARVLLATAKAQGIEDIDLLIAYPHVQPALHELGKLADTHPQARLAVLSDDPGHAAQVDLRLAVYLDLDLGMGRTGIAVAQRERIRAIARAAGERFAGLHAYEGHVIDPVPEQRLAKARPGYEQLLALHQELLGVGLSVPEIVTSGTPAFLAALSFAPFRELDGCVHRVSPGTVVFHDLRSQEQVPELRLKPAALVFSRVISRPGAMRVTLDAGSKSLAVDAGHPCCAALGAPELAPEIPSEEHLPARILSGAIPDLGDSFYLVPRHVCPTVNLAENAVIVEAGRVREIVPVAARAHELSWPQQ
ncbi:MAG: amino acid aldolase [Planctomycetota bacterium]|nr:MAG: amino acid aldolase [Planctomycetota bacterium]